MSYYEFLCKDPENNRDVLMSEADVEYLGDVLELFLHFLQGAGYSFVGQLVAVSKDEDQEWSTN